VLASAHTARQCSPAAPRRGAGVLPLLACLTFPLQAQTARRVEILPAAATIEVGRTVQLGAAVLGARRDTLAVPVRWVSLDTAKALVNAAGLVLARDTGTVAIAASAGRARGTVRLTLRPAVLVGAGDIGACDLPGARQTGELLDHIAGTVFTAGDNAYPNGTRGQFASCYDPAWGRHKARTRPTPGNHDYRVPGAASYFDYFGPLAGERGRGWYAYDLGGWRIYALNSNVAAGAGSEQETWLRGDLASHPSRCALAYWHHARFSSARGMLHGTSARTAALFRALYDAGAEAVAVGHNHTYERFAPQAPDGARDAARGIREFVVGTGGGPLHKFNRAEPNSEFRYSAGWGVLELTLYPRGYTWRFLGVDGGRVLDSGTGACH
jgi:hypothetical protein